MFQARTVLSTVRVPPITSRHRLTCSRQSQLTIATIVGFTTRNYVNKYMNCVRTYGTYIHHPSIGRSVALLLLLLAASSYFVQAVDDVFERLGHDRALQAHLGSQETIVDRKGVGKQDETLHLFIMLDVWLVLL